MKNTGDGRRIARMEKEVQQTVASYLISSFRCSHPALVTVTSVRMPGDLRAAKVYVSILIPHANSEKLDDTKLAKMVLSELQDSAPDIQGYIGMQLKTRYCPKLTFYRDESTEHVLKVERILHDLEKEREGLKDSLKLKSSEDSE